MSDSLSPGIVVAGWGAVTPAGWGMEAFRGALSSGVELPSVEIKRCEASPRVMARPVPAVAERPAYFSHARLRRSPPIARFAAAAALEALGDRWEKIRGDASFRLGVVFSLMNGCVTYSRRFFAEVLENPSTASPILFPETVFNAPSSHISALLGVTGPNYTLAGDSAGFLLGLDIAAQWLVDVQVDGCIVVAAEEYDWLSAEASWIYDHDAIVTEGAGALFLEPGTEGVLLEAITPAVTCVGKTGRKEAAWQTRQQLEPWLDQSVLFDSLKGLQRQDRAEAGVWNDWKGERVSVNRLFGEGYSANAAWQSVAAVDALRLGSCRRAIVTSTGSNEKSMGAVFSRPG